MSRRMITGKVSKTSQYKLKDERFCMICGQAYTTAHEAERCVCPDCIEKYKLKPRRRNSFPCNSNPICKKCAHRLKISYGWICNCLEHTGHIRDLTADATHCNTFLPKGKEK